MSEKKIFISEYWIALVPEPRSSEVELGIGKLKSHKSPGFYQIPAELINAGSRKICFEIYKYITSIRKKEELPEEWKESITESVNKKWDKTDCINYRGTSLLTTTYKILSNILLSRFILYGVNADSQDPSPELWISKRAKVQIEINFLIRK